MSLPLSNVIERITFMYDQIGIMDIPEKSYLLSCISELARHNLSSESDAAKAALKQIVEVYHFHDSELMKKVESINRLVTMHNVSLDASEVLMDDRSMSVAGSLKYDDEDLLKSVEEVFEDRVSGFCFIKESKKEATVDDYFDVGSASSHKVIDQSRIIALLSQSS
jgi:hypothetical protein